MVDVRDDPKVRELVRRLRSTFDPCTIYLFGSHATGEAGPHSDYDVMVVVPDTELRHFERQGQGQMALRGFEFPVDLVVYTRDEWEFLAPKKYSVARQVKESGVLLHAA